MTRAALGLFLVACAGVSAERRPLPDEVRLLRAEALGPPPLVVQVEPAQVRALAIAEPETRAWVAYWSGPACASFARRLDRADGRRAAIEQVLSRHGLPLALTAVPLVESGHLPGAESEAGAVGEWQLLAPTARSLGLRVDPGLDERRDPDRSAEAGAAYLAQLVRRFPDPYLAWTAYNAGPEAVTRALREARTADYWSLARSGRLSPEAANYVPKLLAAAVLLRDRSLLTCRTGSRASRASEGAVQP